MPWFDLISCWKSELDYLRQIRVQNDSNFVFLCLSLLLTWAVDIGAVSRRILGARACWWLSRSRNVQSLKAELSAFNTTQYPLGIKQALLLNLLTIKTILIHLCSTLLLSPYDPLCSLEATRRRARSYWPPIPISIIWSLFLRIIRGKSQFQELTCMGSNPRQ